MSIGSGFPSFPSSAIDVAPWTPSIGRSRWLAIHALFISMRSIRRCRFLLLGRCAGVQASQHLAAATMSLVIVEDDGISLPGAVSRSLDRDRENVCAETREAIRMALSKVTSKALLLRYFPAKGRVRDRAILERARAREFIRRSKSRSAGSFRRCLWRPPHGRSPGSVPSAAKSLRVFGTTACLCLHPGPSCVRRGAAPAEVTSNRRHSGASGCGSRAVRATSRAG